MTFECRLDPLPDPPEEPVDPGDIEPMHPNEPPDTLEPFEGFGWAECVSPHTYHSIEPGHHHFEVRATDAATPDPLMDLTPAAYDWTIDLSETDEGTGPDQSPPDTFLSQTPGDPNLADHPTISDVATFKFSGSDNLTPGLRLTSSAGCTAARRRSVSASPAFAPCTENPLVYGDGDPAGDPALTPGMRTFDVRAIDMAACQPPNEHQACPNTDPTPATWSWNVLEPPTDYTPPVTTITSGPDPTTVSQTAAFTFITDEPKATFECRLDGALAWELCESGMTYTGLERRQTPPHKFEVRAIDQAANAVSMPDDSVPAEYEWIVGLAPETKSLFCGQVVTKSIILNNDLHDCIWDGIVVGANGITIDLNGHLIDGKGIGAGVRNDGYDSVTITNGIVEDFDYGVMLNQGTTRNIVEEMTVQKNQEAGIVLGRPYPVEPALPQPPERPASYDSEVNSNTIRRNNVYVNHVGVWLTNKATANVIAHNDLSVNGAQGVRLERVDLNTIDSNEIFSSGADGVLIEGSNSNSITNNALEENSGGGISVTLTSSAPAAGLPSNDNVVEGNSVILSGGPALEIAGNSNMQLTGNSLVENYARESNGEGIKLYYARDSIVRGNDVRQNKSGIKLSTSTGTLIEDNDASESEGDGINLQSLSVSNIVRKNISNMNDGTGIYIGDETSGGSGILIEGNHAHDNKGYGIFVPKVSHVLTNNHTNDNDSWGIWASEGSNGRVNVDGGGNRAQGNIGATDPFTLKALQCFSIQCLSGVPFQTDRIPPITLLGETPPEETKSTIATFRFSGSDNSSTVTYECRLNEGQPGLLTTSNGFTACTSPSIYGEATPLAPRWYTFEVRAKDVSGNVDESPAVYTWYVLPSDGTPDTFIDERPDSSTVSREAHFEFSSDQTVERYECKVDLATAFTTCPSPLELGGLPLGTHKLQVRAVAGSNPDPTPATWTWRVASAPVPYELQCGEILVRSVLVTNDLVDCPGNGIIIGASGITVDLDGHTIDGVGTEAGIANLGFNSVTIKNGLVTEFDYGVMLHPGTQLNVVTGIRAELNQEAGIALADADEAGNGNSIRNNIAVMNKVGIALYSNTRYADVHDNQVAGNDWDGIRLEMASENKIHHNEVANSTGFGINIVGGNDNLISENELSANHNGISVGEELIPANGTRVESNTIADGLGAGIQVVDSADVQILYNIVRDGGGPGLSIELGRNGLVKGNDFSGNAGGIMLGETIDTVIESNNASGGLGTGIEVGESLGGGNKVLNNAASANGGEGIAIEDSAPVGLGVEVQGNTTDGNGGDGITVEGVGHLVGGALKSQGNIAQLNGGWGIYAVGAIDRGNNFAAGNMEPGQCFGVVCTIGVPPGSPDTFIREAPPLISNSRNASFTYDGIDDVSLITELVFECRLDTDDDMAWEDCEYPAQFVNLAPGYHTFEVRAIDLLGAGLADATPAKHTWRYTPLPPNVAPTVSIDLHPPAVSWLPEAIFTYHANEPDVTFECRLDGLIWEFCSFDELVNPPSAGWEVALEENQFGTHTFEVRATDFEGNSSTPSTVCALNPATADPNDFVAPCDIYRWHLMGLNTVVTSGPGYVPPETPFDPAEGGPTLSNDATITFEANVADSTYECSLDLEPFVPCNNVVASGPHAGENFVRYENLLMGEHMLRIIATSNDPPMEQMEVTEYEWEVLQPPSNEPPTVQLDAFPQSGTASTKFEFTGVDDLTPPELLTFECRLDSTNNLAWEACVSPFNLLDLYTYEGGGAGEPVLGPGPHTFQVRAIDGGIEPPVENPNFPDAEGEVGPPYTYTWTMTADTFTPGTGIVSGPAEGAKVGLPEAIFEFTGTDNATPVDQLTFDCQVDNLGWVEGCTSPEDVSNLLPGLHTFKVRAHDLLGNVDPTPAIRTWTLVAAPITTFQTGPQGRIVTDVNGNVTMPATASTVEHGIFTWKSDQNTALDPNNVQFECALDGLDFVPCSSPYAIWGPLDSGTHELQVRGINRELVVEEPAAVYEWIIELGQDLIPPNTSIVTGPPLVDSLTEAAFEFAGTDNRVGEMRFECSLDNSGFNSCSILEQFSDLTRGTHNLKVRAIDVAGLADQSPAQYNWTVAPPPLGVILTGPEEIVESRTARFTFTSDVTGSTFWCWIDGVEQRNGCTSPMTYGNLAPGEHMFAILAIDPNGVYAEQWEEWEWTVGNMTPPITTISSGPNIESEYKTPAEFVFAHNMPNDPLVYYECSIDGGEPIIGCTSPFRIPRAGVGEHSFEVTALHPIEFDIFGETVDLLYEPVPAVYEWIVVDTVAPDTSIDWAPPNPLRSSTAYFGVSSTDPAGQIECFLDFEASDCGELGIAEYTELIDGEHIFMAQAVDENDNVDPTPATYTFTVTRAASNTPAGQMVTVTQAPATLTFFDVSLGGSTSVIELGGGPLLPEGYTVMGGKYYAITTTAEYGDPVSLCLTYDPTSLDGAARILEWDGSLFVDVTTTNNPATGKVCAAEIEAFSIYALAGSTSGVPLPSIITGPDPVSDSNTATFTFMSDIPDGVLMCSIDGVNDLRRPTAQWAPCESPMTFTYLENGSHKFEVQAMAPDGTIDLTKLPALWEWEVALPVDITAPETRIVKGPGLLTGNEITLWEFTGIDDQTMDIELEFECLLDGVLLGSCDSVLSEPNVPGIPYEAEVEFMQFGKHTFEVRAIDEMGNMDPTPAKQTFTYVDILAPDTEIDLGPESETEATIATFTFIGEEENGTFVFDFECSLDGADFTYCTSPTEIEGLTVGPHVFEVRAMDPSGRVDTTPELYEWLVLPAVDRTAPDTTIAIAPGPISGPDVLFGFQANEIVEEFECMIDGEEWQGCDGVLELEGLTAGQHTVEVRAYDLVLNVDPTPATHTWMVVGEPETNITLGPELITGRLTAEFRFGSDQTGPGVSTSARSTARRSSSAPRRTRPAA